MKRIESILSCIRQWARRFPLVLCEPLRAEENASIEQVSVDALHQARTLPDEQGENRPQRSHGSGREVGGRRLRIKYRRIARRALGARQAHERLRQRIDAWAKSVRAVPAKSGHMGLDQTRVDFLQHVWTNPHTLGGVRTEISQEDVRRGRDLLRYLLAFWRSGIDRERPLVGVQIEKVGPTDGPRDVSLQGFHLNDIGAEVCQQPPCSGPSDQVGDLQYPNAPER